MIEKQSKRKAGRPKVENPLKIYAIRLDKVTVEKAREAGNGNLSKGIRILVELGYKADAPAVTGASIERETL